MKQNNAREKHISHSEVTLRRLAVAALITYSWILIWALVLKLGNEGMLINNYTNLKDMTFKERIMWDLIPFNYRPVEGKLGNLIMDTILNCFVFSPYGVIFCYVFKKVNVLRDATLCLSFSLLIELTQLFTTLGNPATEDLITNMVGYFIGLCIYALIFRRLSTKQSTIIFACANAIFAAATVFSLVTTLSAADLIFKIITKTL